MWKQAVALLCLAYAVAVWLVPLFMLPFVNVLPYVHERDVLGRLPFSIAGSILIVATLMAMSSKNLPTAPLARTFRQKATHWLGLLGGLVMFTYFGAELSPNMFGLATRMLTHQTYVVNVTVESVKSSGSKYKAVDLEYKDPTTSEPRYLVLSKRLFDYPKIQRGDVLELTEQRTFLGSYIQDFALKQRGSN